MRLPTRILLLLPSLVFAAEPPASPTPPPARSEVVRGAQLAGSIKDGRYFSATGAFSIPVPALDEETGAVLDTPNIVVFRDRVATLISIAAFKMPADERWNFETSNPKDYTVHFLKDFVIPDFNTQFPGTQAESATFLPDLEGGTLLAYVLMPGGSAFEVDALVRNHPDTKPPLAKRLNLLFVRDGYVFVLSTELAERVTELSTYMLSGHDEDRILRERLLAVLNAMSFPKPAPAAAPAPQPAPAAAPAAAAGK